MNKKLLCALVLLFAFCFTGCNDESNHKYLQSPDTISGIEIIQIDFQDSTGEITATTLCQIADTSAFLEEFENLEQFSQYTGPLGIHTSCIGIKFIYTNGEYERISHNGRAQHTIENGLRNYRGWCWFDEDAFFELVAKFLT